MYIPFDDRAGESEFLEMIYSSRKDIEPLCDNTYDEECYYVRHNLVRGHPSERVF